uniref:VRK serine/threonine kinase 3 n=1 Tax=Neogobius melanostomus TaxID=47308 RepID=A0A8C6WVU6_9GOBI
MFNNVQCFVKFGAKPSEKLWRRLKMYYQYLCLTYYVTKFKVSSKRWGPMKCITSHSVCETFVKYVFIFKGKGKSKKSKVTPALEPLQEGTEVTDTVGKNGNWSEYSIRPWQRSFMKVNLKYLGAKDGKIFNEQNFLQRAAKPASIEKWIKQNKMDFIGLPQCVGFGLHADSYRFPPVFNEQTKQASLDVLQYIHTNEYVHADINAENVYINEGHRSQVYLVGYNHAFRYCPGGHHVDHREGSRTPHEGAVQSISLDSHDGAGHSVRRSDLQSLGYCMLYWHTGTLPWTTLRAFESFLSAVMGLEYNEQPDYTALKSGLTAALTQLGGSVGQPLSI